MKFKLFANCLPVKGISRSIICDLQRHTIDIIPNDLYEILNQFDGSTTSDVKKYYNNQFDDTIDEYFTFLEEKEFIFYTENPKLFPALSLEYDFPFEISNAIIDIDNNCYDVNNAVKQIEDLFCKVLQIRIYRQVDWHYIQDIILKIERQDSIIQTIEFFVQYSKELDVLINKDFFSAHPRVSGVYFYNSPKDSIKEPISNNRGFVIYSAISQLSEKHCGNISPDFFAINVKNFSESQKHNSCLNRKISIDKHGYIKNCPSMNIDFGHINDTYLKDVVSDSVFRKYWDITKDNVLVCKDCEFRYVCTDCRAYVENPDDINSKPLKCGYSPKDVRWEDWSLNPLKQQAIQYYQLKNIS